MCFQLQIVVGWQVFITIKYISLLLTFWHMQSNNAISLALNVLYDVSSYFESINAYFTPNDF